MLDKFSVRKKKGSSEAVLPHKIRVLKINKKRFVVGLKWQTIKPQANMMKAVKNIGKEKGLDVVAIRRSDSYQAGFAPKTKEPLRGGYSLIVTMASLLEDCCIAVIDLGENDFGEKEFTLVGRNTAGGIHPMSDEVLTVENLYQTVIDMKGQLRGNNTNLQIPIYGCGADFEWITDELQLDKLLSVDKLNKEFKLKPLTFGMTDQRIIILCSLCLVFIVAAFFIKQYMDRIEADKRLEQIKLNIAREELNKAARYKAALDKMSHPWIAKPSVSNFIAECRKGLYQLRPSVKGWTPFQVVCSDSGMHVSYLRPQNSVATTLDFIEEIKRIFGVGVDFNYTNTSITEFIVKHQVLPDGDDPSNAMGNQLVKMISLFQSMNIAASFSPVAIKDKLKNDYGEDLPLQDWQEYGFSVTTNVSPQLIFKNDDFKGIRLNSIKYKIDSIYTYEISGSIYGIRPKETYPSK